MEAFRLGYRLVDTAQSYGNEAGSGDTAQRSVQKFLDFMVRRRMCRISVLSYTTLSH